jgi:branched-chain amino acid transport system ATP-binding protein
VRTCQNVGGFADLTVRENLDLASRGRNRPEVLAIAERLGLTASLDRPARDGALAGRRLLSIAMALAQRPRMLLLDEPLAGLDAEDRATLVAEIAHVHDEGTTVLLIEHDIERVLELVSEVVILDAGRAVASGPPAKIAADPAFHDAYLGG